MKQKTKTLMKGLKVYRKASSTALSHYRGSPRKAIADKLRSRLSVNSGTQYMTKGGMRTYVKKLGRKGL